MSKERPTRIPQCGRHRPREENVTFGPAWAQHESKRARKIFIERHRFFPLKKLSCDIRANGAELGNFLRISVRIVPRRQAFETAINV